MKIPRFEYLEAATVVRRRAVRIAAVGLLASAALLFVQTGAFASGDLSSTILSIPEPGFVATPLGVDNGPITQSNVGQILDGDSGATAAFGRSLQGGDVAAYIRSWSHQPADGDAFVIAGFQFVYGSDEDSFLGGLDDRVRSQAGSALFDVANIPGATGAEVHITTSSNVPLTEYVISFAKGNTVFQVVEATSSGDLTSTQAVAVADAQFANAPDIPAGGTRTSWHLTRVVPLVGTGAALAIIFLSRRRKYPVSLRGVPAYSGQNWAPPALVPARFQAPPPPAGVEVVTEDRPKVGADQWQ